MRTFFALMGALLLLSGCQTQPVRPPAPPQGNVVEEVALECKHVVDAWNAGDLAAFSAEYAESATFAIADGFLAGRQAIREFYRPNFEPGAIRDELAFEQLEVEVLAPDAVLVRAIYRNSRNGEVVRKGTTSLVFRRIVGQWRIIHDHSS